MALSFFRRRPATRIPSPFSTTGFARTVGATSSYIARYALPGLTAGTPPMAPFADLCETFDAYRFNTVFEQFGPAAFDMIVAEEIADLRPRGIYNPVPKIIGFYRNHVLTGRMVPPPAKALRSLANPDAALPDGDLWVDSQNNRLADPIMKIWRWSNLQTKMAEVSTNAATYGNCLLIVNEEPPATPTDTGKVYIEVAHPACLVDFDRSKRGFLTYARVDTREYDRDEAGERQEYTLSRIYTPSAFTTLRDGEPFDYYGIGSSTWENPHGFVPVVLVRHLPVTQDMWGLNSFGHKLPAIHELCIGASVLGSNILKFGKPRWMIFGAAAPAAGTEVESADDMWFFPDGSKADTMIPKLNITDTYVHLSSIMDDLENEFPELHIDAVGKGKRDVSGAGIRGELAGLIRKGLDARERYEDGIKDAIKMALSMGSNLGGTGQSIWGGDIGSYEAGDFEFEFHWPDILPMNRLERLRVAAEEKQLELQIATIEAQLELAQAEGPEVLLGTTPLPTPVPAPNAPDARPPGQSTNADGTTEVSG